MIAHAFKPDPFGFRDQCDEKLDEGDGKTRMCGYKRSEHSQPLRSSEPVPCGEPNCEEHRPAARLPDSWRVDAAGRHVRFCRPHETLSFDVQTARALAAALLAAADEADVSRG